MASQEEMRREWHTYSYSCISSGLAGNDGAGMALSAGDILSVIVWGRSSSTGALAGGMLGADADAAGDSSGLEAGVDCFEHTGLAAAPEYPDEIVSLIRDRTARMNLGPLFWTPTIEGLFNYEYIRDNPEQLDDPAWHEGLTDAIIADIRASIEHPDRLAYFQITPQRRPRWRSACAVHQAVEVLPLVPVVATTASASLGRP